ncbi:O-antigen ligase family protein [Clostridium sp. MB40-C1]|uniref:O-antigen ligase family protein n=1 Tax=Clostridium sp. MB40-C1 TaxID=3070996 RepID=UPI0027E109EA|nr:O-antigen ligase family protein [Clostridium sp. MB40-C1]WMJ81192.1 O-antigen ligase family protein [Clostridium sp. MB40-C1]
MSKNNNILNCLIYLYIIILAIAPSKVKGVPIGDIIFLLIAFVYIIKVSISKKSRTRLTNGLKDFARDSIGIFMLLLFIVMGVSVLYASYKGMALKETFRFATYVFIYFILKYEVNDKRVLDNIIKIYVLLIIGICCFGILQYFTKIGVSKEFIYAEGYAFKLRIPSTLENPNSLGAFLILPMFPLIMVATNVEYRDEKILYWTASILAFINIVLCGSRNAWLGVLIGAFLLIIIYNWKAIVLFLIGGGAAFMIPQVRNRLLDFRTIAGDGRIKLWKIAVKMIKEHPITGVGNGNYYCLLGEYVKKYPELDYNHHVNFPVHNSYLKILSELGIAGIISFIGLLIAVFIKIRSFTNKVNDKFYKAFYTGFTVSVIVFFMMNINDNLFFVPKISMYFWILVAISQSMIYNNSRSSRRFY